MNDLIAGKRICFDFSNSLPYKRKKELVELSKKNGLKLAFNVTPNLDFLVKDNTTDLNTSKCKHAFKLNVPVLNASFLTALNQNLSTSLNEFLIKNTQLELNFKNGIINSSSNFLAEYFFYISLV